MLRGIFHFYSNFDRTFCKALVPQSLRSRCDLSATEKYGNRREVSEVTARFYKGRNEVAARSEPLLVAHTTLLEISCHGSNFSMQTLKIICPEQIALSADLSNKISSIG